MVDVTDFVRDNDRWLRRRVAARLGARGGELDDVMQTVYVQLWRAANRIRSDEDARRYCLTAAANVARDNARRHLPVPVGDLLPAVAGLAPDPADVVIQREVGVAISSAVASLTPDQRTAWIGYELHGMSYAALAASLSLTPAAIRGLLHRARSALQRNVELVNAACRYHYDSLVIHAIALRAKAGPWTQGIQWPSVVVSSAIMAAALAPAASKDPGPRDVPAVPSSAVHVTSRPVRVDVPRPLQVRSGRTDPPRLVSRSGFALIGEPSQDGLPTGCHVFVGTPPTCLVPKPTASPLLPPLVTMAQSVGG